MTGIIHLLRNKINLMLENEILEENANLPSNTSVSLTTEHSVLSAPSHPDYLLASLQKVDGYLAFTLFAMSGEILVQDNNSKYSIETVSNNAALMIKTTIQAVNDANVGKCNFIQINSDLGIFIAVWVIENESVAMVLLDSKANVGLAKIALANVGASAEGVLP